MFETVNIFVLVKTLAARDQLIRSKASPGFQMFFLAER